MASAGDDGSQCILAGLEPHAYQDKPGVEKELAPQPFSLRHGRACPGHPPPTVEALMAGTRPAMTIGRRPCSPGLLIPITIGLGPGHPRLELLRQKKSWMASAGPAGTRAKRRSG